MAAASSAELEEEINRLAAEALAVRMVLVHVLSRLSASANPETIAAIKRGFAGAERALKERATADGDALTPAGLAQALSVVENLKTAALAPRETRAAAAKEGPATFHAESNDRWPEDDY
jgi:hypothetical protein